MLECVHRKGIARIDYPFGALLRLIIRWWSHLSKQLLLRSYKCTMFNFHGEPSTLPGHTSLTNQTAVGQQIRLVKDIPHQLEGSLADQQRWNPGSIHQREPCIQPSLGEQVDAAISRHSVASHFDTRALHLKPPTRPGSGLSESSDVQSAPNPAGE